MKPGIIVLALAAVAAASIAQEPPRNTVLPLGDRSQWQILQYRGIPPHKLRFSAAGLEIAVDGSAMPLIYPFPRPVQTAIVRVRGRVAGTLRVAPNRQGEKGFDDYVFRVGLVEPGSRTLNFMERQTAAPWVRKLFELAPGGSGISRVHFLNVASDEKQIGRERQHPGSDLMLERVVAALRPDGRFDFVHRLERPLDTIAVWLSSDGDDSGSKFVVHVERIELHGR